jgi:DNA mismatch endonuclease (patch repair protein)
MDTLTREQRSLRMSLIRSKNTKPERLVRRLVRDMGYRYRLCVRSLPGAPDIVLSEERKVIFVNGCFWHRHSCAGGRVPKTRRTYWLTKLKANAQRDARNAARLKRGGWRVLVIWECQTKDLKRLAARIHGFLTGRFLAIGQNRSKGRS